MPVEQTTTDWFGNKIIKKITNIMRNLGDIIPFNLNFEPAKNAPIDARLKCPTYDDLLGNDTTLPYAYKGMIVAVTDDPDPTKNGVYVRIGANIGEAGTSVAEDWKKIDGRITGFAVINDPTDGDFADQGNQIIRITQSNGSSEADTFFDILTSDFVGGGGFRFLGLATDHANPVPSDLGFLENETSYDFLAGDVFRIKNSGSTDGLYYVPADVTLTSQSYVLWSTTWTNAIAAGEIILFHEDVEPGDQLYNSSVPSGTVTVEDHGGIPANTDVDTLSNGTNTLSDILDQILFPAICPTAPSNVPSISFTASPADNSLFVIGETVDIDFTTGAANLGLWNTADSSSQVYQGDIITSTLTGPNGLNQSLVVTNNNPENPSVTGHTIVAGSGAGNTWTLTTVFAAGTDPVDNFGDVCDGLAPGSTTKTSSIDFEGVYPVFQGTSVIYTPGAVSDTWDSSMDPSAGNASWSPIALFSFETLSSKEIYQGYGESDNAATWVNHRFAVPNYLGLSSIQVDGGQLGWQNATSTFNAISGLTLTINGQSVDYTIYERVNADAGGANNYRLVW
jgi:hypothetical protein